MRMMRKQGIVWCESGWRRRESWEVFRWGMSVNRSVRQQTFVSGTYHRRSLFIIRHFSIETNVRTPSFCVFSVYSLLFAGEELSEVVESWDKKWAPSPRNGELSSLLHLYRFVFAFCLFSLGCCCCCCLDEPCPEGKKQAVTTLQGWGSMGMSHKRKNKILDRVPSTLTLLEWIDIGSFSQTFTHSLSFPSFLHVSCHALVQVLVPVFVPGPVTRHLLPLSLCLCFFVVLFVYVVDCWFALVTFSGSPPPAWPFALFCFVLAHLPLLFCPDSTFSCLCSCHHFHAPLSFFLISPCTFSFPSPNQPANKPSKCKHWRKRRTPLEYHEPPSSSQDRLAVVITNQLIDWRTYPQVAH